MNAKEPAPRPAEPAATHRAFLRPAPSPLRTAPCPSTTSPSSPGDSYAAVDHSHQPPATVPPEPAQVTAATTRAFRKCLAEFRELLAAGRIPATPEGLRLLIGSLEETSAALAGLQMQAIATFDTATREANAAKGFPVNEQGRGVTRAVAMATRTTPYRGAKLLSTAKLLTTEMPHTYARLCDGTFSLYHTQIVTDEARRLPTSQRRTLFDKRLAADIAPVKHLGPKTLRRRAQALVDELHPASAAERFAEESKASCYVELEELGDGMSRLTATMPTPHAAYVYTVLEAAAGQLPAVANDPRTGRELLPRGQAMTQALYQRFAPEAEADAYAPTQAESHATNLAPERDPLRYPAAPQASAGSANPTSPVDPPDGPASVELAALSPGSLNGEADATKQARNRPNTVPQLGVVPVTIDLVISDKALLGYGEEPATVLTGGGGRNCGGVPASIARALIANGLEAQSDARPLVWLRKLYANDHGALIATSSKQRFFPEGLATMLRLRDQGTCRTPWCDAPIRHSDHVTPWSNGGATSLENAAGQCVRCNQSKDAPEWNAKAKTDRITKRHQITYTEPTGKEVLSTPPVLPKPATLTTDDFIG